MDNANYLLESVEEFRKATGLPVDSGLYCDFDTHVAVTMEELIEAADGMTDSLVTLAGIAIDADEKKRDKALEAIRRIVIAMDYAGFDAKKCIDIVHKANMSKLCDSFDEAEATQHDYLTLGVDSYVKEMGGGKFAVFCADCATGKDGKFYPKHKLLKSAAWHEPDWSDVGEWMDERLKGVFE